MAQFRENTLIRTLIKAVKFYHDELKRSEEVNSQLKQLTKAEYSLLLDSRSGTGVVELNFSPQSQEIITVENDPFFTAEESLDHILLETGNNEISPVFTEAVASKWKIIDESPAIDNQLDLSDG